MSQNPRLKLPGWARRPKELTPPVDLRRRGRTAGPDIDVLLDPRNDVAYKMIGGAYGVLGAEVLGHFVPRVLDQERWGVYVREAAVAWLCRELSPHVQARSLGDLPFRMARSVGAHHHLHSVVEAMVTAAHGEASYLDLLVEQSPRHGGSEERLAELSFWLEAISDLDDESRRRLDGPLRALMARTPEGAETIDAADVTTMVEQLNTELSIEMSAAGSDFGYHRQLQLVPCYLVIEPHLPEPLATSLRRALLG